VGVLRGDRADEATGVVGCSLPRHRLAGST
jgi:hypothetical protein